ncbi:MAG: flagellar protein export ATPase FliI [bacterium]|nr:flagellar protein export ATPase FliI [bacterium]
MPLDFERAHDSLRDVDLVRIVGKVVQVVGLVVEAQVQGVSIGELCRIVIDGKKNIMGEVVGFKEGKVLMMPLGQTAGIKPGSRIYPTGKPLEVKVGMDLLGRVLNGLGEPMDNKGPVNYETTYPIDQDPPDPVMRPRIENIFKTGVKPIDATLTLGQGQRVGIFAGSGVGKSTLMGMLARNCEAEINVIALVGERGREVKDFIEESLGIEGLKKSVVICATSDAPPLVRLKGAMVGTAVAEYFRNQGKKVLFMMDSVTRFAMAQREIGLATGEPPTTKGYTPSVFAMLPRLMERAGTSEKGSITAIYTVLVDGGDMDEPIADAARGILDGHIMLSRDLAARNHYPCIDIGHSVSRLMASVAADDHKAAAGKLREVLAKYNEAEDLINIGAYVKGSNPRIDNAIDKIDAVNELLKQKTEENIPFEETVRILQGIF